MKQDPRTIYPGTQGYTSPSNSSGLPFSVNNNANAMTYGQLSGGLAGTTTPPITTTMTPATGVIPPPSPAGTGRQPLSTLFV